MQWRIVGYGLLLRLFSTIRRSSEETELKMQGLTDFQAKADLLQDSHLQNVSVKCMSLKCCGRKVHLTQKYRYSEIARCPQTFDERQNAELRLILMEASITTFGPRKVTFGVTVGIGNHVFVWDRICSFFYQTAFSTYQSLVR